MRTFTHLMKPAEVDQEGCHHADILVHYPDKTFRVTEIEAKLLENPIISVLSITFKFNGFPQSVTLSIREDKTEDKDVKRLIV